MNPKQTVPLIAELSPLAAAAPPLLIFAGIGLTLYWLFSGEKEKKPDAPANAEKDKETKPAPVFARPVPAPAPIRARADCI